MEFDYKSYSNQLESENERLNAIIDELEEKIDKAIEYIKNEDIDICTIRNNDIIDTKNELLEILGDKE